MKAGHTQDNLQLTITTPLGKDELLVRHLRGEEMISGLFHYHLELVSENDKIDFTKIIDKPVTVHTKLETGTERWLNGLVTRFVQGGTDGDLTTYYAELRPKLWLTTLASDCRTFQQMTVSAIIESVLKNLGFSSADYKLSLTATYEEREYTVQYKEITFHFLCRMMEDEGIYFFFEHKDGEHKVVFADSPSGHPATPGVPSLQIQQSMVGTASEAGITQCTVEESVVPKQYFMKDFDYNKPLTSLLVSAKGKTGTMEHYEFVGGYTVAKAGETRAVNRLEAHEWAHRLLSGSSYCRGLIAGHKFELKEHYRDDVNAEYVVHWLSFDSDERTYSNSFRAFPSSVPFKPLPVTPRPRAIGSETAIVVGAKDEEIFADAKGRVKVQFHWDREGKMDEKSSCWIRVAQPWAGTGWGSQFLPRVGQEVVVHYLDGDPDRPLITGSVYNGEHEMPYNPAEKAMVSTIKSRSTPKAQGFNEIRMDDKKENEEFYFHAQKNMTIMVKHDRKKDVLNDEVNTIKKNRTTTIEEADDTLTVKKGNQSIEISKGNRTLAVKTGNETITIKGNYTLKVDGNITIEAGGSITLKAQKSLLADAGMDMTNKAGTDLKASAGMNMALKAGIALEGKATIVKLAGSAMAEVKGGGMLTLKGGVVMVN